LQFSQFPTKKKEELWGKLSAFLKNCILDRVMFENRERNRLSSAAEVCVAGAVGNSFGVPMRLIIVIEPNRDYLL
jgi:hypothetical protein